MAGDWIKVEHATVDKPEIARIADLLGIRPNEALGLMICFWVWCDRHSRNGVVTHMSRTTLDNVTHTPGFAACLIDVGWAQIDDDTGAITISNHDRHNGTPAKTRALGRDRTAKSRNAFVTPTPSPDNIRLDIKPIERSTEKKEKRQTLIEPTPEHQALADSLGVACKVEFAKYRDWLAANGKRQKDEAAGFRNWIRKAAEFRPAKPQLVEPTRHGSHVPAKLPVNEPHTEMPEHIRAQLSSLTGKLRVS